MAWPSRLWRSTMKDVVAWAERAGDSRKSISLEPRSFVCGRDRDRVVQNPIFCALLFYPQEDSATANNGGLLAAHDGGRASGFVGSSRSRALETNHFVIDSLPLSTSHVCCVVILRSTVRPTAATGLQHDA